VLLLDEPPNHLDLESGHWLQDYLLKYEGCLIVISHDRHFLNEVCTHVVDIDYETVITYTGGYDDMVLAKTQIRARVEAQNAQREKKIAQLNEFIARFSAGTRSSHVMSRKKRSGTAAELRSWRSRTCNARRSRRTGTDTSVHAARREYRWRKAGCALGHWCSPQTRPSPQRERPLKHLSVSRYPVRLDRGLFKYRRFLS